MQKAHNKIKLNGCSNLIEKQELDYKNFVR